MNYKHGGNLRELAALVGRKEADICDFSANINPLGPPDWLRSVISRTIDSVVNYPDPDCKKLVGVIAEKFGISSDEIVIGNGTSDIIRVLPLVLGARRAVIAVPSYVDYSLSCQRAALTVEKINMAVSTDMELDWDILDDHIKGGEIVFLANPNNPTGLWIDANKLRTLAQKRSDTIFVIDEAFIDFIEDADTLICRRPGNIIVLRSMTKFYAIPGIRLGFAVANTKNAQKLRDFLAPWSVNSFAQTVGVKLLTDKDYAAATIETVNKNRQWLCTELSTIKGLYVYPGRANFLLVKITDSGVNASELAEKLIKDESIAIRVCENFDGLDKSFFRVAVRNKKDNERLVCTIRKARGHAGKLVCRKTKPAIMFQGCSSSAGKSLLTTALCRVLLQDGVRVAPFKAQNMSLNSFVTRDGCEMGRAQVVQAQACKLDPDVRMNPILLKPNSDTGSQVIVLGKPVGNMNVLDYSDYKSGAFKVVKEAYDSLAAEYDVIVLEGAGSPAEINIKQHDIVNMKMAQYAHAPVLLVGDIDRGGVFASFVGTMELLTEAERGLVAGFIVNRFRGDKSLLEPAFEYMRQHTGKLVLGVIPYLKGLNIPEEDSVGFKSEGFKYNKPANDAIEIVVIDLPHISNFTDFDPLGIEPDVNLRVAREPQEIGSPDALIIPGSKNIISDLDYLKKTGTTERIKALAATNHTEIIGICAGFQILGKSIKDPHQIESANGTAKGLGLLAVETVLARSKTLKLAAATHIRSSLKVKGYEIHHGQTTSQQAIPAIRRDDAEIIGIQTSDGNIWGTYLHGIFDCDEFRRWFIDGLRIKRGMRPAGKVCATYDLESAFDNLADVFRQSVCIDEIYKLMGL